MIFQYTIDKVLDGSKTHTSRLVMPGDELLRGPYGNAGYRLRVVRNNRIIYAVKQPRAVQPGRGKFSEGRIVIKDIAQYDVRNITDAQAKAEGFERWEDFLFLWCRMHDWKWYREYLKTMPIHGHDVAPVGISEWYGDVCRRPAQGHYNAWDIEFQLVEGARS